MKNEFDNEVPLQRVDQTDFVRQQLIMTIGTNY